MNNLIFMKKIILICMFFCLLFGGMQSSLASFDFGGMSGGVSNPNDR